VPKDPRILPSIAIVAPYPLPREVVAELEARSRQIKEVLASSPGAFDLRRMRDIEAGQAAIKRLEHQAAAADRRSQEAAHEAASYRQEAKDERVRLAVLMRSSRSVGIAAAAPDVPGDPQSNDRPPVVPPPGDRLPVDPVEPADPAAAGTPKPGDPRSDEPVAAAIVRVAKDLYPDGVDAVIRKVAFAGINDALATEARNSGKPPPPPVSRDRVSRALGWRKG
jgi:hypothetical protein